jgi:hypothetical protein
MISIQASDPVLVTQLTTQGFMDIVKDMKPIKLGLNTVGGESAANLARKRPLLSPNCNLCSKSVPLCILILQVSWAQMEHW